MKRSQRYDLVKRLRSFPFIQPPNKRLNLLVYFLLKNWIAIASDYGAFIRIDASWFFFIRNWIFAMKRTKMKKKNWLKPSRFAERSVFKSGFCCCYVFLGEIIIKFVWNFQKSSFIVRLTERSSLLQFVFFLDFRITIFKANIGVHLFWQLCH